MSMLTQPLQHHGVRVGGSVACEMVCESPDIGIASYNMYHGKTQKRKGAGVKLIKSHHMDNMCNMFDLLCEIVG